MPSPGEAVAEDRRFPVIVADCPWDYDQFRDSANGAAVASMNTQGVRDIARVRAGHRWAEKNCMMFFWATGPKMWEAQVVIRAWGFKHKTMVPWLKTAPSKGALMAGIGIIFDQRTEYLCVAERGKVGGHYNVHRDENGKRKFVRLRSRPPGVLVGPREYPVFWDERVNDDPEFWNALTTTQLLSPGNRREPGKVNNSKKPLAFYDWIEEFGAPILEIYARREPVVLFPEERRKLWTSWGRETGVELGDWGARRCAPVSDAEIRAKREGTKSPLVVSGDGSLF